MPLEQYRSYMDNYRAALPRTVTRERVRTAFSHLVIGQKVLDQVGPAVAAGHSMFVYGPPGNGKTVIAQAIQNLLDGEIDLAADYNAELIESFRRAHGVQDVAQSEFSIRVGDLHASFARELRDWHREDRGLVSRQ